MTQERKEEMRRRYTEFGSRVKAQRERIGMTQEGLATFLRYQDVSRIQKIEEGKSDIPLGLLPDFAEVLETTQGYLLGLEENQNRRFNIIDGEFHIAISEGMCSFMGGFRR